MNTISNDKKTTLNQKGTPLFNKKIILFLISQNVSLFGSSVVGFTIIWYITLKTSSGVWLMMSTISYMLPQIIISLWGGVWADRHNRKHLIMISDGFIALATLGLAIAFWAGFKRLELLLIVSIVRSLGSGIQMPAVNAIYPQLVAQDKLVRIQGINQTLNSILLLLAPAVGGLVLASMHIEWAFMLDVVTATLAIFIVSFIKVEKIDRKDEPAPVFTELKQGIDYAFQNPFLRRIIICYAFSFFLITPAAVLSPLMVIRSYGNEVWRLTSNEISWTIGSLIGGMFVSFYGNFKDKIRIISMCLVAFGICFALLGIARSFSVYLIIMGISGLFMPILATAETVLIQEITDPTMMGRVFSIVQIIASSSMPVAILIFGPLADVVAIETIILISGLFLALVGVLYYYSNKRCL